LIVPLLAFCWSLAAAAQGVPAQAPAATPAKAGPEVIAAADIPQRADVDERFAQDVVQRSHGRDPTLPLRAQLDALAGSVREEGKFFKRDELRLLSIARLESLERHWKFYGKELDQWRNDLKQVVAPYNEDAAELRRRSANWEATRAAPESTGLAPALSGRMGSVLAQLALAEQAVSGPIAQQVRLGRQANNLETAIRAGQKAVATAINYNDSRLTKVDSPPLWTAWDDPRASGDAFKSLKAGLEVEQRFLAEYNEANADYLRKLHVLALLLLPLLLWLSYRSRKVVSDDPEIQASTRVLQRPLSSWIVLMMVGIVLFEPDAPILRHQLAFLLALVPVLRLLPAAVYQVLGPWPYIATGLYLLNRLSFVLVANPFYHRIYLLAITLLTAVMVSWVLWRRRPAAGSTTVSTAQKFTRTVAWAAIATLLVSAVANVIGNVSLAEMLTVAILDSGYVGLVLYAGVTVLASVMQLLLARKVLLRFNIISHRAGPLLDGFKRLLRLAAWAAWVIVVLNQFRVFRPIEELVRGTLTHELRFGQISVTLGGVLLFFFSVWLAFWIGKTVRVVLHDDVLPRMSLPRGVANSISSLTYYAVVIFGLFVALAAAGFEVGQLAIVIGALGVGIGLGLQDVVRNFVSGLILMFERPIQPGDVVEVGGTSGKVREIGMRATTLSTFEGADVVVPNGMLLSDKLINWTLSDMDRRIDVNLGVAYGSDPRKVLELLAEVTRATPGIATTPEPTVLFVGFGASALDFGIRAWTNNFGDWVKIRSDLAVRVHDALQAAGVVIPFPQQDVHVRSITPAAGAVLAGLGKPPQPSGGG
jgi:small-conductance mechanosensitive channel